MTSGEVSQRLREFETLCRRLGTPVTVQRRSVLQAVLEREDHPTADQILAAVKDRVPGIARTTVYRVLDALVEMGIIRRLHHAGTSVRFDGRVIRHHHLVCSRCHKVIDLEDARLDRIGVSHIVKEGFEIEDFSVHLLGVCEGCRQGEVQRLKDGKG